MLISELSNIVIIEYLGTELTTTMSPSPRFKPNTTREFSSQYIFLKTGVKIMNYKQNRY